jgi:hypothetical protein
MPNVTPLAFAVAVSALSAFHAFPSYAQQPALKGLRFEPATVPGGHRVQGTVELSGAAGPNGVVVGLASGSPQLAPVPASVTVAPGASRATFSVDTRAVIEDETVEVKALVQAQAVEAELRLRKPAVQAVTLAAPSVCDGVHDGTLRYLLSGPAPAGLKVVARAGVDSGGARHFADSGEAVPAGASEGSIRVSLPRCTKPLKERCEIAGWARINAPAMGVTFVGSCGAAPD